MVRMGLGAIALAGSLVVGGCGFLVGPGQPSSSGTAAANDKSSDGAPGIDTTQIDAARKKGTVEAFAELKSNPALADKAALLAFDVAVEKGQVDAFEEHFSDVPYKELARLAVEGRALSDTDDLGAYLKANASGPFSNHAEKFLKAKHHKAQGVIAQAKAALNKSPITKEWEVDVLGFVDGNIFLYVTNPPIDKKLKAADEGGHYSFANLANYGLAASDARKKSCALVTRKLGGAETCLTASDPQKLWFVLPRPMAAKKVFEKFYKGTLDATDSDVRQALVLLHQMTAAVSGDVIDEYEADSGRATVLAAREYWALGLHNTAAATLVNYVRRRGMLGPSTWAKRLLKKPDGLINEARVKSLLEAYERYGAVKKGKKWVDADVAGS